MGILMMKPIPEAGNNEEAKQSGSAITSLLPPRKDINGHTTALQNTVMRPSWVCR